MSESGRAPPVGLASIAAVFAKIGLMSFGGALSGWLHREIVLRRGWLEEEDFLSGLALGQIMPGINVANLSLYVGHRLRGGRGAVVALLAILLPPMALMLALAAVYSELSGVAWLHRFIAGVAAAAVGLTVTVGIRATRRIERRAAPAAILAATLLTIGVLRWPMIWVTLAVTPVSIALAWPWKRARNA